MEGYDIGAKTGTAQKIPRTSGKHLLSYMGFAPVDNPEVLVYVIIDDGIGMAPEQVAALLQNEPSDRTGIGIKNVNDRLRIYFGPGYGLSIDSVPDEGTTVTIRMPQVPADREGDYDKTR